jgi:hypothetical protein
MVETFLNAAGIARKIAGADEDRRARLISNRGLPMESRGGGIGGCRSL